MVVPELVSTTVVVLLHIRLALWANVTALALCTSENVVWMEEMAFPRLLARKDEE